MATPKAAPFVPGTRNLYSLNDRPLEVELGQLGKYTIAAKPEGAPWGVTVLEDRRSWMDKGEDEFLPHTDSATSLCEDIIVRYPGLGLFIAEQDDRPSASEVNAAEEEFALADAQAIATAHQVWDAKKDRSKIDIRARDAARRRNQVVEWAATLVVELRACPYCGENIRTSATKCRYCSEWLDGRNDEKKDPSLEDFPTTVPTDVATKISKQLRKAS